MSVESNERLELAVAENVETVMRDFHEVFFLNDKEKLFVRCQLRRMFTAGAVFAYSETMVILSAGKETNENATLHTTTEETC